MWKDREVILGELPPLSRQTSISIIDERWSDHFRIHQWRGRMNISQCIRTFLFDQYHTWYLSQAIHVPYRTFVCTNFEYTENYPKHQSYAICHTDPYFLSCPAFADGNMGRRTSQTMRRGAGAQSSICIREARRFQNEWFFGKVYRQAFLTRPGQQTRWFVNKLVALQAAFDFRLQETMDGSQGEG